MGDVLLEALDRLRKGDEAVRVSFGFERLTTWGGLISEGVYRGQQRLSVDGQGNVRLTSTRSVAAVSGEGIGDFEMLQPATVDNLAGALHDANLSALPPFRIEPADMAVRFTTVGGGVVEEVYIGRGNPAALMSIRPLINLVDGVEAAVRQHPSRVLSLSATFPSVLKTGRSRVTGSLLFENPGTAGYWLKYPGDLSDGDPLDECTLVYSRVAEAQPGVTPLPPKRFRSRAIAEKQGDRELMWIGPGSKTEVQVSCGVDFPEPGRYVARFGFSTYAGEDWIGGQRRIRGCVFSKEFRIDVA